MVRGGINRAREISGRLAKNRNRRAAPRNALVRLLYNLIMLDNGVGDSIVTPMGSTPGRK